MSSKSHDVAGMAIAQANFSRQVFLCTRMFQNRISDSVYTLLASKIEQFSLSANFKVYADAIEHIRNGSVFRFYGIARGIQEIKSFEGATRWWNEESQGLTAEAFATIRPTVMRNAGAEMWFTMNPQLASDFSYQKLIASPPEGFLVRQVNYPENIFLGPGAIADIEATRRESEEDFTHIYLGAPRSDDESSVIKRSWLEAAVDAHIHLDIDMSGGRTVGYDVADSGADKNACCVFDGSVCIDIDEWAAPEDELNQSTKRAWAHVQGGSLLYDSIGVGAHVGSTLSDAGIKKGYFKFNAAGAIVNPDKEYAPKIKNKEKFENLKAQAWQDVADRLRNTFNAITKGEKYAANELISISSDLKGIEKLKTELSSPRKRYSKRGLDMVETKDELAKRGISSPNLADSFIMGACPHLVERDGYSWKGL